MTWYYLKTDCESSPCLLVPEEEYSGDCCTDGEPCVPLKSKITHAAFYCNGKLTESYLASLSGMTCEPSTENHGEGSSTSSREAFLAKTLVQREKAQGLRENDPDFGKKWQELSVKYDLNSSSWKTHRYSENEVLQWSSVTLPKWGMMRGGECWEVDSSNIPPSFGKGCGWLPAPMREDGCAGASERVQQNGKFWNLRDWYHNYMTLGKPKPLTRYRNARFWEYLMGWVDNWTALRPLEMDKFQSWLQQHGKF